VTSSRLPREIRRLLETDLDSIDKIEAIRHLRRALVPVPRDELMRALHLEREAMHALIAELSRAGLVDAAGARGAVRLGGKVVGAAWDELMRLYEEDRVAIVAALSELAVGRIRTMAARAFGEALVSRKKSSKDEDSS